VKKPPKLLAGSILGRLGPICKASQTDAPVCEE
jgi:hypothetical protein